MVPSGTSESFPDKSPIRSESSVSSCFFFRGIITWLGFHVASVGVKHAPRYAGGSAYSWRLLRILAVQTIVAHSDKPLRIAIGLGFLMAIGALAGGVYVVGRALSGGIEVSGWASLMVSIYFLSGMIVGFMGILGFYVGLGFDDVKGRPLHVIRKRTWYD